MNKFLCIIIITSFYTISFAFQTEGAEKPEFYARTTNISSTESITLKLIPLSTVYCSYNNFNSFVPCSTCSAIPEEIITGNNSSDTYGFEGCWDLGIFHDQFGFGIYKILVTGDVRHHFYLDLRDCNFVKNYPISSPDQEVLYDGNFLAGLKYDKDAANNYDEIYDGSVIKIWEEWGEGIPSTELMPANYWVNSLGVPDYGLEEGFSIPIFWGKEKSSQNITKFRIHRAITSSSSPPEDQYFSWIADVDEDVFHFKDNSLKQLGDAGDYYFHYYIESFSGSTSKNRTLKKTLNGAVANWSSTLIMSVTSNNHPKLLWGPHPTMSNITGYKIYRAVTIGPAPRPELLLYSFKATTSASTFDWTDPDVTIGGSYNYNYYYIKAYNSSTESSRSNIVNSAVLYYDKQQMDKTVYSAEPVSKFSINSNYPNPFNPVTTISFELPSTAFTKLAVYDIYGKEIAVLVQGDLEEGHHTAKFDGSDLPSGIYFYRINSVEKSGKTNSMTRRMLLIK